MPTAFVIPSSTATLAIVTLPPSWTPSATPESFDTDVTPQAGTTGTPPAGAGTPTSVIPLDSVTVTATPTPLPQEFPFVLQAGTPTTTQNLDENGGCAFLGIAGQVFGIDGDPLDGIAIVVKGENFDNLFITQFVAQYGLGSYELQLNNEPIEAEFEVQLFSVSGDVLSNVVVIRTASSCEENVTILSFIQVSEF